MARQVAPKRFEFAYPLAFGVGGFGGSAGGWVECLVVRIVALSIALFRCANERHQLEVPKRRQPIESW